MAVSVKSSVATGLGVSSSGITFGVDVASGAGVLVKPLGDGKYNHEETARGYLDKARREIRPETGPLALTEVEYLTAVYNALAGDVGIARLKLQHMQAENPEGARYEKLLSAFGK